MPSTAHWLRAHRFIALLSCLTLLLFAKQATAQVPPGASNLSVTSSSTLDTGPGAPAPSELLSAESLEQLAAPIALYPDALVAQILVASTFPVQVVEATRWLTKNDQLSDDDRFRIVDTMAWDQSVKALTAFPDVLRNMDTNLSWTAALGRAYFQQPGEVMAAIQRLRQRAQAAGTLTTGVYQSVYTKDGVILIVPTSTQIVYVPSYNPWIVYGAPLVVWPGWYAPPAVWYGHPVVYYRRGCRVRPYARYGWGWTFWGANWWAHSVVFHRAIYHPRMVPHHHHHRRVTYSTHRDSRKPRKKDAGSRDERKPARPAVRPGERRSGFAMPAQNQLRRRAQPSSPRVRPNARSGRSSFRSVGRRSFGSSRRR